MSSLLSLPHVHRKDFRKGGFISRQNDPAYHRAVQYTHRDLTIHRFSEANAAEIVRMLCKDQGMQIPDHMIYYWTDKTINLNTAELNSMVESAMENAIPLQRIPLTLKTV